MPGKYADGTYGRRPWSNGNDRKVYHTPEEAAFPPQEYLGPFQSNQDRLLNQALATWTMAGAELQEYVRPNLPQINLFPDRYGYTDVELGLEDIVRMPRGREQRVESDFSNTPNTTQSTSRNTLGGSI